MGRGTRRIKEINGYVCFFYRTAPRMVWTRTNQLPCLPQAPSVTMVKDKKASEFATRDYTIHLSKRLYGVTFKKRAPRAVREVKKFAQQMMKTRCVAREGERCPLLRKCVVEGGIQRK